MRISLGLSHPSFLHPSYLLFLFAAIAIRDPCYSFLGLHQPAGQPDEITTNWLGPAQRQQRNRTHTTEKEQQGHGRNTHNPSPATSLNSRRLSIHRFLHLLQSSKVFVDLLLQNTPALNLRLFTSGGSKVLPEQRVVNVTTTVKLQSGLKSD